MKICAGIVTWQDGPALVNAVESVRPFVDEVVIVDGLLDGLDPGDLQATSDKAELLALSDYVVSRRWETQSQMRQCTLALAKALNCDWLLAIDADEQLMNGELLRPWLEVWRFDAFPLPFHVDENTVANAAFKLLHVPSWRRYVCQGSILENQAGQLVQVLGQTRWTKTRDGNIPYLAHRPELRPAGRRQLRLSEHEVELEPYPDGVRLWVEPVYTPPLLQPEQGAVSSLEQAALLGVPVYYCRACGRRYYGPGFCSVQHERTGLEPVLVAASRHPAASVV